MLLRLAYLGVTNALAMLRLLPMSDRAKDAEILALRHQIMVLQRQLHGQRVRFTSADRALLAALLHRLPRTVLRQIRLLVRPETVLRWAPWSCDWRERTVHGDTGASTANYSSWASRSPHPPSGKSSTTPTSTQRLTEHPKAGRCSYAPKPRRSSPRTSLKP